MSARKRASRSRRSTCRPTRPDWRADPTGRWLVAGTSRGDVAVFTAEGREDFVLSESSRLHEGAVTALLFEPDELRFLSSRGRPQAALDPRPGHAGARGQGARASAMPTRSRRSPGRPAIGSSPAPATRPSRPGPASGGARPATLKDGVAKVRALAVVHGPRAAAAGRRPARTTRSGSSPLDAAGKFGDADAPSSTTRIARARHELAEGDPRRREAAVADLAGYGDAASLELLARALPGPTATRRLRLDAARRVARVGPSPIRPAARRAARPPGRGRPPARLRPAPRAARRGRPPADRPGPEDREARHRPPGRRGPGAARPPRRPGARPAARGPRRHASGRSAGPPPRRSSRSHPADSPEAEPGRPSTRRTPTSAAGPCSGCSIAACSTTRRCATALRRRAEDADADVRRVAFLLLLRTRPDLARRRSGRGTPTSIGSSRPRSGRRRGGAGGAAREGEAKAVDASKAVEEDRRPRPASRPDDLAPLLNAAASRSLDTALRGARGLALLGDPRAFGLLLQLSREDDASARVEVCRALAELGDAGAVDRLRSLLHDPAAEVRDAAFTAPGGPAEGRARSAPPRPGSSPITRTSAAAACNCCSPRSARPRRSRRTPRSAF